MTQNTTQPKKFININIRIHFVFKIIPWISVSKSALPMGCYDFIDIDGGYAQETLDRWNKQQYNEYLELYTRMKNVAPLLIEDYRNGHTDFGDQSTLYNSICDWIAYGFLDYEEFYGKDSNTGLEVFNFKPWSSINDFEHELSLIECKYASLQSSEIN